MDWITDRPPTEADGDRDGDVCVSTRPGALAGTYAYLHWSYVKAGTPWRHSSYRETTAVPEPEPVEVLDEPERTEIPEAIRTGAAPFYVLVISDDNPRGPGGEPIVWEHPVPRSTTLQAVLERQASLNGRYGTTHIAECRIIPQLTREVPANA